MIRKYEYVRMHLMAQLCFVAPNSWRLAYASHPFVLGPALIGNGIAQ